MLTGATLCRPATGRVLAGWLGGYVEALRGASAPLAEQVVEREFGRTKEAARGGDD
jgi:hypothetical protein